MAWFKRGRSDSQKPARKRKLPQRHLAPVEEIVEQGLMVADVATRMTVKNDIILNTLGRKADYDEQQIVDMVRDSVIELAEEREKDAQHIARMRGEIRSQGSSNWSDNNYGGEDSRTLRHRQEVYEGVAAELRLRAEDEAYLDATAEKARTAAWREIGDSLKERASHPYYSGGSSDEYKQAREERIQLLIQRDLTSLVRNHGPNANKAEKAEKAAAEKPKRTARKLRG